MPSFLSFKMDPDLCEASCLNCRFPSHYFHQSSEKSREDSLEGIRRTWPTESTKWCLYGLKALMQQSWVYMGLHQVPCLWLFCQLLGLFFSFWLPCPASLWELFALFYCILLCLWLVSLEACIFLKGDRGRMDLRKMGGRLEWGKSGGRGNCDLDVLFERNLFSIVKRKERKCLIKCHNLQILRLFYFLFCCKVELSFLRVAIFKTPL